MFTSKKHQVLFCVIAALFLIPITHADVLVVLDGIEGESTAEGFPGRPIDALGFSWGMSRPGAATTGISATRDRGTANFEALTFAHKVDKSSPKLMEYCATGKAIPRAIVAVRKTSTDTRPSNYYVMELENVIVTAVSISANSESGEVIESFSLGFDKYKITYTQQDDGGKATGRVETSYNIVTAKM